jgi:hypothetical protein
MLLCAAQKHVVHIAAFVHDTMTLRSILVRHLHNVAAAHMFIGVFVAMTKPFFALTSRLLFNEDEEDTTMWRAPLDRTQRIYLGVLMRGLRELYEAPTAEGPCAKCADASATTPYGISFRECISCRVPLSLRLAADYFCV